MKEVVYPAGPASIPNNLTSPSRKYRLHAWLAVLGLLFFLVAYFSLAIWFCMTAYRLISGAVVPEGNPLWSLGTGIPAAILAAFMLKSLFFVKRSDDEDRLEVSEESEPVLFAFLHRLADDAGAPRPHKVYVTSEVNAAVFYHLTFFNLLFPSKKNLQIGLGLVNVLNLSELKAVLAHEFGHFAQKSMAVGTWVYIAHQVAVHLIHQRDAMDGFLDGLSRFDLRVAWIGWLLKLIIWSIRSLLDTIFMLVVVAERALSREMELQADLVAVSLTGSDALIHALHKLNAADEAWERSLSFATSEAREGRGVPDMYSIQSRVIEHLGVILDDPEFGQIPALPEQEREKHRLFNRSMASPPKMWSTHPENSVREENAKKHYVPGVIDDRSAWIVFANPDKLRSAVSNHIYKKELEIASEQQSLENLDRLFNRAYLFPRFRGAYLGRSVVRHEASSSALCDTTGIDGDLAETLSALYPADLAQQMDTLRNLREELRTLEGIRDGYLSLNGGVIRHRDRQLDRKDLSTVIEELLSEVTAAEQSIYQHDKLCRSAHRLAALKIGGGWEQNLEAQLALLHYADHTEAELADVHGMLSNVVAVITADGHVSSGEINRLLTAANEAYDVLARVYGEADKVDPGQLTALAMEIEDWKTALGEFELPAPSNENINEWMQVIDGWLASTANSFAGLKMTALEQLLDAETLVAQSFLEGRRPDEAPRIAVVPDEYVTRLKGSERKLQTRLDFWDRFQTATGFFPAMLRFGTAASIIGSVIVAGLFAGGASVTIYNGLATPVQVELDGRITHVGPFASTSLHLPPRQSVEVKAYDLSGSEIEMFDADASRQFGRYVYNVAGASPLVQWTQVYGIAEEAPPQELGAPRWAPASADVLFEEPPESVSTSSGSRGTVRTVLTGLGQENPFYLAEMVEDEKQLANMVSKHVEWDSPDSPYIVLWLQLANEVAEHNVVELIDARLTNYPNDVFALRQQQDVAEGSPEYSEICARHHALAAMHLEDANLQYVSARCGDESESTQRLLEGAQRWPDNPWFNMASGHILAERAEWKAAVEAWQKVMQDESALQEWVSLDLARVLRVEDQSHPELESLTRYSRRLGFLLSLENEGAPEEYKAYTELSQGNLEGAKVASLSGGQNRNRILRLIAASDGADEGVKAAVQTLSHEQGVDYDTMLLAWTQMVVAGRDTSPLEEQIKDEYQEGDRALAFLREIQESGSTAVAADMLEGFGPRERGLVLAAGVVILGDRAPVEWREQARALLFAIERPYFKTASAELGPLG
ncbi:M48 family metallopeptidase [Microbulbifer agarilyticus]